MIGGAINNAGSAVRWASQTLAAGMPGTDDRDAALLAEAAEVAPGSDGLLCLPYLLGERAPWWRPGVRGAYLGLRPGCGSRPARCRRGDAGGDRAGCLSARLARAG